VLDQPSPSKSDTIKKDQKKISMNIVLELRTAVRNDDTQQVKNLLRKTNLGKDVLIFVLDEMEHIVSKHAHTQMDADMLCVLCEACSQDESQNNGGWHPLHRTARSGNRVLFDALIKISSPQTIMGCLNDEYVYNHPDIANICLSHWDNQFDDGRALMGVVRSGNLERIKTLQEVSHMNTAEHILATAAFVGNKKIYKEFLTQANPTVALNVLQEFEKLHSTQPPPQRPHLRGAPVKEECWNGVKALRLRAGILEGVEGLGSSPVKKKM